MGASWVGATANEIAHAVQRGDVPATRVIADHCDHARFVDVGLGCLRVLRDRDAIAEAELVDEQPDLSHLPLAGVPVLVSEDTKVAGTPTWNGPVAEADHEVVRRLRGAGAVIVGVTRTAEFGLWATTDDAAGVTRNPWRADRTPGGSCGGAAAAVAAGVAPVAHATDGFGSLRIPAACCGLIGLKPGHGLIEYGNEDWHGLAEHGILATTVADARAGYAAISGRSATPVPVSRLRLAVSWRSAFPGVTPDDAARAALARVARTFAAQGHDVVAADPPYPRRLAVATAAVWFAVAHAQSGRTDPGALQTRTRRHAAVGARIVRRGWVHEGERLDWRQRCLTWMRERGFDGILLPTIGSPPPPAAQWSTRSWPANVFSSLRLMAYTVAWNEAGLPAIAVPAGVRPDGLPASVQLVGTPGTEWTLLEAAALVENALPWRRHAPLWPRAAQSSTVTRSTAQNAAVANQTRA